MIGFFRRKKPQDGPDAAQTRPSTEELAAAFPRAPGETLPADTNPASDRAAEAPVPASAVASLEAAPAASPVAPALPAEDRESADAVPAAAAGKSGWRDRLRRTSAALGLAGLFTRNPRLDDDLLDEIETALLTADVGVPATTAIIENLRKRMKEREFADAQALLKALRTDLIALIAPVAKPLVIDASRSPSSCSPSASMAWARPPPSASSRAASSRMATA